MKFLFKLIRTLL